MARNVKTEEGYVPADRLGIGFGSTSNVVIVPWTGITQVGATQVYTVQFGTPEDRNGSGAAADWTIVSGTPGVTSDRLTSANRTGLAWWSSGCFQCGPEVQPRRAFLSTFYDEGGPLVGIVGCASGLEGNNDRAETTVFEGGLLPGFELLHSIAWNGSTPLTLNSGHLMLFSS